MPAKKREPFRIFPVIKSLVALLLGSEINIMQIGLKALWVF